MLGEIVIYRGHNCRLKIVRQGDDIPPMYFLQHEYIWAPGVTIAPPVDGKLPILINFQTIVDWTQAHEVRKASEDIEAFIRELVEEGILTV